MGDYRIIYGVDKGAKQITVHYVRHRSEAYRKL
jgi:mRNA-degrading endonuclease RelE of RelBE toxin-antitoxin system